jgi:class 3 adenylate cyclase
MAEKMDPHAVVALINEYLTEMTQATTAYHGYINNFIGDAIVVIFGAPIAQPDAERRAVRAAVAMRSALASLNVRRAARGDVPIETGIGIAVGDMVAGQIGSPERMLYTVIGDAVNVAARLEALTKDYPGKSILITKRIADALVGAPDAPAIEPLGPIKLKGRTEPVEVFAVAPQAQPTQEAQRK